MPGNSAVSGKEWGNVYAPYISVHRFIQILVCCSHCISHINRLIYVCLHVSVCTHIWKSLHACTYMRVCKHARPKQEPKLSSVSTPKTASVSVSLSIYICVWELASVSAWPPECTLSSNLYSECVSATADRQVTLAEQVEAAAMRSLRPDSGQTRHRPVTKGGPVWWGSQAAGVCVNVYGICLYACCKSWACSPPSIQSLRLQQRATVMRFLSPSSQKLNRLTAKIVKTQIDMDAQINWKLFEINSVTGCMTFHCGCIFGETWLNSLGGLFHDCHASIKVFTRGIHTLLSVIDGYLTNR